MADEAQRLVVIGAGGRLGAALMREYRDEFPILGFDHEDLDLADPDEIDKWVSSLDFDVLINCAAFTNVDLCESQREKAFQVNAEAPKRLAEICVEKNAQLIHFSTDYVFDGEKRQPYSEEDEANPISVYGDSKRAGELNVLEVNDQHLVIRVSWVFGPERPSFIDAMIKRAREEDEIAAVADKFSTPTYTGDIAEMLKRVVINASPARTGILHFTNEGQCSWQEYAQHALDCCRSLGIPLKAKSVGALKLTDMRDWIARRPVYSVLSTSKFSGITGSRPRSWRDAVTDYIERSYSEK
jgi:dTDP-4-dehydrorhamnose reductase